MAKVTTVQKRARDQRARRRWLVHAVVALVIGGAVGAGAVALRYAANDAPTAEELTVDLSGSDRVQEVLAGLRDDGVHVTDDGRYLLDEDGEQAVAEAITQTVDPVYVVVWAEKQQIGANEYDVKDYLAAELGDRGTLIIYGGPQPGASDVEVLGPNGYVDVDPYEDLTGDPAVALPEAVATASDVDYYDSSYDDGDLGVVGGVILGALLGLLGGGVLLLVGWILRRVSGKGPMRGRWGWRST